MIVTGGDTNVTTYFVLRLAADGTAATGLTITSIDLQYTRSGVAPTAKVDATALAATDSAHGDNQAIEIDATDQPGLYRVDWPDAAFAAGVREVTLTVKIATVFTEHLKVEIDPFGAPAGASVSADIAAVKAETVLIVADTNELQTDWANGGRLDVIIDAILADTVVIGAPVGASISADIAAIKAETVLIVADTNELQTDWVDGGRLDLIVDAILVDTAVIGVAGAGLTDLGGMSTGMKAEVNVEVDGALDTAVPELSVAAPTATPTMRTGMMLPYMALRNKLVVQTSGTDALEVYNDAGTKIAAKLITDDGADYTEAEMA